MKFTTIGFVERGPPWGAISLQSYFVATLVDCIDKFAERGGERSARSDASSSLDRLFRYNMLEVETYFNFFKFFNKFRFAVVVVVQNMYRNLCVL